MVDVEMQKLGLGPLLFLPRFLQWMCGPRISTVPLPLVGLGKMLVVSPDLQRAPLQVGKTHRAQLAPQGARTPTGKVSLCVYVHTCVHVYALGLMGMVRAASIL